MKNTKTLGNGDAGSFKKHTTFHMSAIREDYHQYTTCYRQQKTFSKVSVKGKVTLAWKENINSRVK